MIIIIKIGSVIQIKNNMITVKVNNCDTCGDCTACSSKKTKDNTISFESNLHLKIGDSVSFEISDNAILKFSILIYIIPLIFFFCGYIVSSSFFKSEGIKIIISFISLLLSFILLFIFDFYKGKNFMPKNIHKI